ncbi:MULTISPECIES: hypothetical protein [Bacillus cereus group]|uniref:hypothetical protein n=1 Tax=Bacillus cereus group TaxID=86661 RepID=UPI0011A3F53D|nr:MULTISPECIES: hypothetical protein [Bacillus cereus group]
MRITVENDYLTYDFIAKEVVYQIHYGTKVDEVIVLKEFGSHLFVEEHGEKSMFASMFGNSGEAFNYTIPKDQFVTVKVLGENQKLK